MYNPELTKDTYVAKTDEVLQDIMNWMKELGSDIVDSIIYETLDTVMDIVIDRSYDCDGM